MVPLQTGESDLEKRPEYVVFTLMFILFGLTVLSANMNLMVCPLPQNTSKLPENFFSF